MFRSQTCHLSIACHVIALNGNHFEALSRVNGRLILIRVASGPLPDNSVYLSDPAPRVAFAQNALTPRCAALIIRLTYAEWLLAIWDLRSAIAGRSRRRYADSITLPLPAAAPLNRSPPN